MTRRPIAILIAGTTLLAACGGGSDDDSAAEPTDAPTTADSADDAEPTDAPTTADSADDAAPTDDAEAAEPDTDPARDDETEVDDSDVEPEAESDPEPELAPEPVVIELAELPDLVALAGAGGEALATAQAIVGFPLEIAVDGATELARLGTRIIRFDDDDRSVLDHRWEYAAVTEIGDVDIALDDNGPGSVEIIEIYDPIMSDLGYRRTGSTGSDPGADGGPNSVNHVYSPEIESLIVNGITATPRNVLIWNDENLIGSVDVPEDQLIAGRRVAPAFDVDPIDGLAVPALRALAAALPVPDGSAVADASIDYRTRSDDSFDIEDGSYFFEFRVVFDAPEGSTYDDLIAQYSTPPTPGDVIVGAESSFFDDTAWEVSEGSEFSDFDWRRDALLLERYDGEVRVEGDGEGEFDIVFVFTLNPVAPPLTAPE